MPEISSDREKFTKIIGTLLLSAGFYNIQVNKQVTKIRVHEGFFERTVTLDKFGNKG